MAANNGQGTFYGATYAVNGATAGAVNIVATATTTGTRVQTLQDATGTIALLSGTQTWTGTQDFSGATVKVKDAASFQVLNTTDITKVAEFSCASISTGTTRTYTLQNLTGTLAMLEATQSFTAVNTYSGGTNSTAYTNGTIVVSGTGGIGVGGNIYSNGTVGAATKLLVGSGSAGVISVSPDVQILDAIGNTCFRGLRANGWSDAIDSSYFQIGKQTNDYSIFTSKSGTSATRTLFVTNVLQINNTAASNAPTAGNSFEVLNGGAYVAAITNTGSIVGLNNLTITNAGNVNTANSAANAGNFPVWVKTTIPYTSFSAASTTNSITLLSLVAGGVIHGVKIKHSTAFAGTGITAMTVSVGVTGTLNKYASAFDVFQAVSNTAFQLSNVTGSENHGAATTILITGTSTGGNLNALTQGSVDVWVLMSKAV